MAVFGMKRKRRLEMGGVFLFELRCGAW